MLIVLITFSSSCKTVEEPVKIPAPRTTLETPIEPELKPVAWQDLSTVYKAHNIPPEGMPTGLMVSYDNYRNLEHNIVEYRRYIGELEKQIKYYQGDLIIE